MVRSSSVHHISSHSKKCFSEEEALEKIEKYLDQNMEKIMNMGLVDKFLSMSFIRRFIASSVVTDINKKITPYITTLFSFAGWISLISGIIGIFSFLISLSGISFMFSLGIGIGVRVLIYIIFSFAFSLVSLFMGIGLIMLKKWVISLVILAFLVAVGIFLIHLLPVGIYSYSLYGTLGSSIFTLIITFILVLLVVKNQSLFTH